MAEDLQLLQEARDNPAEVRERSRKQRADEDLAPHDAILLGLAYGWACYVQGDTETAWRTIEEVRSFRWNDDFSATFAVELARLESSVLVTQGKFDIAELRLGEAIKRYRGQSRSRLFGILAHLFGARGDLQGSLDAINSGLEEARETNDERSECALLANRAVALLEMGRFDEAEQNLAQVETIALSMANESQLAIVLHNRGVVNARRGRLPVAIDQFQQSAQFFIDTEDRVSLAHAFLDRSKLYLDAGLHEEARAAAESSVQLFDRLDARGGSARVLLHLARVLASEGQWDQAASTATRAAEQLHEVEGDSLTWRRARHLFDAYRLVAALEQPDGQSAALDAEVSRAIADDHPSLAVDAAMLLARQERTDDAARLFESVGGTSNIETASVDLDRRVAYAALALMQESHHQAAERARDGIVYASTHGLAFGVSELRATAQRRVRQLVEIGVVAELERSNSQGVVDVLERSKSVLLLPEPGLSDEEFGLLTQLGAIAELAEQAGTDEARTLNLMRRRRLEGQLQTLRRRHHPDGDRSGTAPSDTSVVFPDDGVYLFAARGFLYGVMQGASGPETFKVAEVRPIRRVLSALRMTLAALAGRTVGPDPSALIESARQLLHPLLVRLGDMTAAVVVPEPETGHIPWPLLTECTVSQSPSLALISRPSVDPVSAVMPIVFAGPGLAYAEQEAAAIGRVAPGAQIHIGVDATVERAAAAFESADNVHFATHGTFRQDNPLYSSLQLHGGSLTFFDLLRVRSPRQLIFSACDVGQDAAGSAMGIAALLFERGCEALIASAGPTGDKGASQLMGLVYEQLGRGERLGRALHRAQQALCPNDPSLALFVAYGSG